MTRQRTLSLLLVLIAAIAVAGSLVVLGNNQPLTPSSTYSSSSTSTMTYQSSPPAVQTQTKAFSSSHVATYSFDNEAVGSLPSYLQAGLTGQGTRSEWSVRADSTAPSAPNVLAQTANESVDYHFPYVILPGQSLADVNISVRFKAVSGRIDQAGGIIFRFVNSGAYYVLRANALEGNVILFKYVGGVRSAIASAQTSVSSGEWHSLAIVATGNTLMGYMDHKLLISVNDSTYGSGAVGLWTKADSVTYFDDLVISY